jgi:hypothetical protein
LTLRRVTPVNIGRMIVAVAATVDMGKAKERTLYRAILSSCKLHASTGGIKVNRPRRNNEADQNL